MPATSLHQVISGAFSAAELPELAAALQVDLEDLPGNTRSLKAMYIQQHLAGRGRLHELLAELHRQRPNLELKPYLCLLIAEAFNSEQALEVIVGRFGHALRDFGGSERLSWGSPAWREEKAAALQRLAESSGRVAELLQALRARNSRLDLAFYEGQPQPEPIGPDDDLKTHPSPEPSPSLLATPEYANFDLTVTRQANQDYMIQAQYSHGGEATVREVTFPLESAEFLNLLGALATLSGDLKQAEMAGQLMRQALLPPDIWSLMTTSRQDAKSRQKNLRLRLRIEPPEIGMLPWEYCWDKNYQFFALRRETPIVRYIELSFIPETAQAPRPARILLAGASPTGFDKIDVAAETALIEAELKGLVDEGLAQVAVENALTWDSLQYRLNDFQPHVLHFMGHGTFDLGTNTGTVALENDTGGPHEVTPAKFASLLQGAGVKIVILNACKTAAQSRTDAFMGIAPALVRAEIPVVIAMQFAIPQETAVRFARQLYRYLALGQPLDRAITETRINIYGYDEVFWAVPVLFMRAPDGVIWQEK